MRTKRLRDFLLSGGWRLATDGQDRGVYFLSPGGAFRLDIAEDHVAYRGFDAHRHEEEGAMIETLREIGWRDESFRAKPSESEKAY